VVVVLVVVAGVVVLVVVVAGVVVLVVVVVVVVPGSVAPSCAAVTGLAADDDGVALRVTSAVSLPLPHAASTPTAAQTRMVVDRRTRRPYRSIGAERGRAVTVRRMGFRLANVDDRAVLVSPDELTYHDVADASGGTLSPDPMATLAVAEQLAELAVTLPSRAPTGSIADVTLGPPVPHPQKVFGIGLNYRDHAAETSKAVPDEPLVFTKFPSCLVGPTADIELRSDGVDYEGELVVVIGRSGRDIVAADAWNHVVGLMVGQDVSDRPQQYASTPPHFDLGKSFDTFGPTGPWLVALEDVPDPTQLRIVTEVNGEVRQDGTTADLILDVPTLIEYLSRIATLTTGDLIFTGTPAGVGAASGRFLRDGDVVTTTISGLGTMTNRCADR